MGVDTKLYISHRWNINDIKDVLQNRLNCDVKITFNEFAPNYVNLHFKERMLHIHTDSQVSGFPAILLSFRSNPEGIGILELLAETFGGILQVQDCNNDALIFDQPDYGNNAFLLNEALKNDPRSGNDLEKFNKFTKQWKNKYSK